MFRTLLDYSTDSVLVVDPDTGEYIDVNETACQRCGYSREELLSLSVPDIEINIDNLTEWNAFVDELRASGTITFDGRHRRGDGTTYPVEVTATHVELDREYVLAVAHDVTERRKRKRELERTKRRFEAVFEDPNILAGLLEPDGTVVDINGTAMEYIDADLDDVAGDPFWKTPWWGAGEVIRADVRKWIERAAAGEYVDFEADLTRPSGEQYTLDGVFRPVMNDDGDVVSIIISSRDVTERKQRERELRENEERLRLALEAGEMGTWELDLRTKDSPIRSPQHDRIFGYDDPLDEWDFETFLDHVQTDEREEVKRRFEEAFETGTWDFECRITRADDEQRVISAQGEFHFDSEGEPTRAVGVVQDITERKQRERELEESERRYHTLADHFPNGAVALVDEDFRYVTFGGTPEGDTDVTRADLEGKPLRDALPQELADVVVPRYEAALDGQASEFESTIGDRVYQFYFMPVRDDSGDIFAAIGMSQDITERRQAEENLQKSKERFHALVTASSDVVYRMSPDWSEMHELEGKEFLADTDELTSNWLDKYIHPDDQPRVTEAIDKAIETKSTFELEYRVEQDDGSTGWTFSRAVPMLDEDGKIDEWIGMASDITERKRRERALERSEQRYRTLANHFPNGAVTLFDDDLKYTLLAGQGFEQISIDPDEAAGRSVGEVWGEDIAETLEPMYRDALAGDDRTVELSYEGREWMVHAVPITDEEGTVFAGMAMVQDITEQKEHERYLRDAKSQLEAATEAGAIGTWEWDVQNDEMIVGQSFARTFGVDPDAAQQGVSLDQFIDAVHENDRERVVAQIEDTIETCGEYESEYRVWNADGELRWVVARGRVECDDDGSALTFPGALTDITERKHAELERQRTMEQLETLVDILPIGVVVADANGSLIRANDTAREIWGGDVFDAESITEYDKYPAVWADTDEPVTLDDWTMSQVLHGAEVTEPNIYEISAFDGEQRIIMEHGMPIRDEYGDVSRAVVTLTDITERREYQRKLEESNERLEQFAYAASHDLQEPLRMVTSYLQLLEKRYDDAFDEDGEEFLEFAVDGAERMREMIGGLLEYSRVETRGDPFEPTDLNALLDDVLVDLQLQIEGNDAEITAEDLPRVEGDAGQLRQVLQNLLSNALTYSGDEPPRVHVSAHRRRGKWVISVADDGIGINPENQDRIFTVFDRLHSREEYDGTGIGLALCERIVERHGGDIWVDSEPGEGATFSFTLPAADAADK
ncbi:PAS domain S-box protein (plasmid) [Natronorubrum aibiense]|uniref:histidine kinase n=1 Tax=Natronorubrum aibiense TaxID=348826 RepID=A0A5P9P9R4_9EURY|nr:PAS domain S-box protein [Natronorubrum aibiense]